MEAMDNNNNRLQLLFLDHLDLLALQVPQDLKVTRELPVRTEPPVDQVSLALLVAMENQALKAHPDRMVTPVPLVSQEPLALKDVSRISFLLAVVQQEISTSSILFLEKLINLETEPVLSFA